MKTSIRITTLFACLGVASSTFASSGRLMFSGIIAEPTCKVSGHPYPVSATSPTPSHGAHQAGMPLTITVSSCAGAYSKLHSWFGSAQSADLTARVREAFTRDNIDRSPITVRTTDGRPVDFTDRHVTRIDPATGESTQKYVADYDAAADHLAASGMIYSIAYD
jgi:type 1 fimbria pilin